MRLVGVALEQMPVLMVLEIMQYGDLREVRWHPVHIHRNVSNTPALIPSLNGLKKIVKCHLIASSHILPSITSLQRRCLLQ